MSRRVLVAVFVGCIAILGATLASRAQSSGETIVSSIPFEFRVGDKPFPAGDYRLTHQARALPELEIQSADGKHHAVLTSITRLARLHKGNDSEASLVFDIVGETHYLSEIWMPQADGFLVLATKGEHKHGVVKAR